jgi:purine nucleosidase
MAGRPDIPVFLGRGESTQMSGAEGMGLLEHPYVGPEAAVQSTPAVDWLLAESRRNPFHLIAIGPLTNVAAAIAADPGFASRLLSLTVMGGLLNARTMPAAWQRAIRERGGAGWPDYNTTSDPAAAFTVAQSGVPITWVTLDVTMRAPLRAATRNQLPADHPLGAALGRMIDAWHTAWFPVALPAGDNPSPVPADAVAILHDPLAVAALFPGDWLRLRPARLMAAIEDGVFRLHERPEGAPAQLADVVDGDQFEAFFMTRLQKHWLPPG